MMQEYVNNYAQMQHALPSRPASAPTVNPLMTFLDFSHGATGLQQTNNHESVPGSFVSRPWYNESMGPQLIVYQTGVGCIILLIHCNDFFLVVFPGRG